MDVNKVVNNIVINEVLDDYNIYMVYRDEGLYHPDDFNLLRDKEIESIIEDLLYSGLTSDDIIQMNKARYGNVIDFYRSEYEDMYYVYVGVR